MNSLRYCGWNLINFRSSLWLIVLAMFSSRASADYATAVLADNPLGYWRFNDSDDVAKNLGTGGMDLDGTYFGGERVGLTSFQLVDGRTVDNLGAGNTAFRVGVNLGEDEYVSVAQSILSDLPQFTMSAWVNPQRRTGTRIGLFGQNDAVEFGFISPSQIQLWTPSGQVLNYTVRSSVIPNNTWVHLAGVADGSSIRLFVNGKPTDQGPTGYGRSGFNFNIGGGGVYDATGNQFTGSLDEVAIWTTALTEEQIQAQVTAAKTVGGSYSASVLATNPLGYWSFNDPDGSTAANQGTGGVTLNGTYRGGDRTAAGPDETYPGFGAGNKAFAVVAPDVGYVGIEASPLSGLEAFTLSGWVKPGEISDNRVGLFGQNDAMEFGFIDPTTLQMWTPSGGFLNFAISDEIVVDEWVHIAAVGDGEQITIYIDGELVGTGGTPIGGNPVDSYGASDFPFNIGGGGVYDASGNQFVGFLDEVAVWDTALTDAQILKHFEAALPEGIRGDFNRNGQLDLPDVNSLIEQIASGANPTSFDLNSDRNVDGNDLQVWVKDLRRTWIGDADLNGEFNSSDFVQVFTAGKYEIDTAASWDEGDWTGDRRFTSSDFVSAFQDAGYEQGPVPAAAVPEPASGFGTVVAGLISLVVCRAFSPKKQHIQRT